MNFHGITSETELVKVIRRRRKSDTGVTRAVGSSEEPWVDLMGWPPQPHLLADGFVHGDGAVGEGDGAEDDTEGVVAANGGG